MEIKKIKSDLHWSYTSSFIVHSVKCFKKEFLVSNLTSWLNFHWRSLKVKKHLPSFSYRSFLCPEVNWTLPLDPRESSREVGMLYMADSSDISDIVENEETVKNVNCPGLGIPKLILQKKENIWHVPLRWRQAHSADPGVGMRSLSILLYKPRQQATKLILTFTFQMFSDSILEKYLCSESDRLGKVRENESKKLNWYWIFSLFRFTSI